MATVTTITCDRCGVQNTYHGVTMHSLVLAGAQYDVCRKCVEVVDQVMEMSIHRGLLIGAEAPEMLQDELNDDRMAELCGCSSSHIVETLRYVEEHMDE